MSAVKSAIGRFDLGRLRGANNEGVLVLVLVALVIIMSALNPAFFTVSTLFSILRTSIVPLVFALAVLIVIVSGGIDVSFPVIAIFSAYAMVSFSVDGGFDLGLILSFVVACLVGALLGLINGGLIAKFRLPTLIVTLGTQGIFKGILLAYIGSRYIADLPSSIGAISTANVIEIDNETTRAYLHVFIVPVLVLAVVVWLLLKKTMFGRGVYAIGGDIEAARRAGFRVERTQVLVYVIAGAIAAFGGMLHVIMSRNANPQDLLGSELDIIAAVVLGGASIFGGRGSVYGTVLGVLLVQLINNSLLLIGVPTAWQRTAVGVLLVVGVGVQALSAKKASKRVHVNDQLEA